MNAEARKLIRFVGAVLTAMVIALAAFADTVTLKREAFVRGPQVLLSEIADIEGDNADSLKTFDVGAAPSPGSSRHINASLIQARLQTAGLPLDNVTFAGAQAVRATTLSYEITPEMLEGDLRQFIESQMPWSTADTVVDLNVPPQTIVVPDGDVTFQWRPSPLYKYLGPGSFRAEVRVDGTLKKTVLCKANIEAYGDVVVAARDIVRGKTVGPADVSLEKMPLANVPAGFAQDPDEVVGAVARANIYTGQPIVGRNTTPRTLVKRGQMVSAEVHIGSIVVRIHARAKTDAREGDLLSCTNLDSKEEFEGVVHPDGSVVVN